MNAHICSFGRRRWGLHALTLLLPMSATSPLTLAQSDLETTHPWADIRRKTSTEYVVENTQHISACEALTTSHFCLAAVTARREFQIVRKRRSEQVGLELYPKTSRLALKRHNATDASIKFCGPPRPEIEPEAPINLPELLPACRTKLQQEPTQASKMQIIWM